ncbi:MAG TPA: hypothetical protein DCZ94_21705 [Lentisphaeria bacterium]|nr:MAG: hypothetical protein A2X48_14635 [Lentisphaerae bacterium GWF2_49_21]HBC89562.1 hypothetical protein [Lentisphaeria bacterium]
MSEPKIITKPSNPVYRKEWSRIFKKKRKDGRRANGPGKRPTAQENAKFAAWNKDHPPKLDAVSLHAERTDHCKGARGNIE